MGIFQRLAATDPAVYEPGLAMALCNAAIFSGQLRRWTDAVTVAERAVGIDRRLAQINPVAHEPPLAGILLSLGTYLACTGQWQECRSVTGEAVEIYRRLAADRATEFAEPLRKAYEAHETARDRLGGASAQGDRSWTLEEHYVTLLNQSEVWQDAQDRRHRLDDMDPGYCGNVLRFLLRQADGLFETLVDGLTVSSESLGRWNDEDAETWLARQPPAVALRRRSEGKPARPEVRHCGYAIRPDWNHDHCYPGIIVD